MRIRVTAILVAKHGGEWLEQTLAGLATQTRLPDRVVAVVNGGKQSIAQQITEHSGDFGEAIRIVSTQTTLAFGAAVEQGVLALPAERAATDHALMGQAAADTATGLEATSHTATGLTTANPTSTEQLQDWFWLLTEDSAPEAAALEEILATVQRAPSVVVAGPKLVNWQHPDRIIELGQSLTQRGDRWLLRRQERDQQQYDHLQDVLGVGPVGMLVRADVWRELRGFDPAYPVYDDALDFSVRARLAGHRVVVSPTSRVRFAQLGVAGPRIERSRRVLRVAHRQARTADLHRRIAYAPAITAFFMWLGLPFVAIARVAWSLIREQPGNMWGEFAAALRVFFRPGALAESRRRLKQANTNGWSAVDPLRVDSKSVRTARMIDREVILASQGRLREDLNFVSSGGLATLVVASLLTLGLTWWAVTQTSLTGGGLAPLSSLGDLWANTQTQGGVPADAFSWVLAILGTLTFYNPSHAVVLMLVAAIPLAALGGFIWAAQLTKNSAGRVLVAFAWAFSPVLLGSLAAGRLSTLILAVVLPWLLLAATRARVAWSWAGVASLLAAVALACAPVLIPAAVVLLVVGIMSSPRGTARVLTVAIGPLVLF
ncbi:MAG: glycosyltransferase family 2 protein, partial [Leucobacter sp.]|nr:glycosyltransferase family 2 protein [Leucobacter sp.]